VNRRYNSLDIYGKLVWNLRDLGHTIRHAVEGKGGQKRVLMVLLENGGMTQRALTEYLRIQPGSVSEVLGKLEVQGLIVRDQSELDRRTTDIRLSKAGEAAARQAHTERLARDQKMFAALSAAEAEQLLTLLEKLNSDWDTKFRKREDEKHVEVR
jgi:DNA-binding MarR family transcriptional regulator